MSRPPFSILIPLFLICSFSLTAQDLSADVLRFVKRGYQKGTIALTGVKIVDGTGGPVLLNQTVVIQEDQILNVGPSGSVTIPEGAREIDCQGKTLLPGFVMLHEHMFYSKPFEGNFSVAQMSHTFPRLYLAGGATTIRTGGSIQAQSDLYIKEQIEKGEVAGPKMDVTAPFIDRVGGIPELGTISSSAQAAEMVHFWADRGCTSFKVYQTVTREDLAAVVAAAHQRNLKVTGHICSVSYREAAELGIDNIEHGFRMCSDFSLTREPDICDYFGRSRALNAMTTDDAEMASLIQFLVDKNVAITSTLPVFEPYTDREIIPGGGEDALAPEILKEVTLIYQRGTENDGPYLPIFKREMAWEKQFYDAGGLLVVGTDPTGAGRVVPGYANLRTMELLAEAGFSLPEAVKIATLHGAKYLEQEEQIGTIAEGKKADLILIDGDLEKGMHNIREIEVIFKEGVGYSSKKLFNSVKGVVGRY